MSKMKTVYVVNFRRHGEIQEKAVISNHQRARKMVKDFNAEIYEDCRDCCYASIIIYRDYDSWERNEVPWVLKEQPELYVIPKIAKKLLGEEKLK